MSDIFDLFKKIEKPVTASEPVSYILVGLGNPGGQYAGTRHNAGFMTIDAIAKKYQFTIDRARFRALTGQATIDGHRGLFIKPQTYMNASGEAVREAADFYKITPDKIFVICDDINLDPGKIRIRKKGSDGGQKGLRSIIEQLGTDEFVRIRMGVGAKPHPDYDLADWVLGTFSAENRVLFDSAVNRAAEGLPLLLSGNIDKAMSQLNG